MIETYLVQALVAFVGGAMGAAFSSLFAFVFVALVIALGLGVATSGNTDGLFVFGFGAFGFYAPQISFAGGAFASAYARWKEYKGPSGQLISGQDIMTALIVLKKPDVLIAGGAGGVLSFIYMLIHQKFLSPYMDGVPFAVVATALTAKLAFDNSLFGIEPAEVKAAGGRFSPKSPVMWLPYVNNGTEKLLWGFIMGLGGAWLTVRFAANSVTAGVAAYVPFSIAVFSLIGFYMGIAVAPNHHIVYCASLGVLFFLGYHPEWAKAVSAQVPYDQIDKGLVSAALIWGTVSAIMAAFFADFLARCFHLYGSKIGGVHVDPPTLGILATSVFTNWIFAATGCYTSSALSAAVPAAIMIICIALAVMDSSKLKASAAS
ncbi:MAG: hypothetical protein LBS53_04485 [Synergistaceae bacterium]|jgi:hypothetical protein|nr:hypothetical protein [Synergistaceae bacterium]